MSTTDLSPDSIATSAPGSDVAAGTGIVAATAAWLTSTDSKVTGIKMIGGSLLALAATAVVGVLLGLERVDGVRLALRRRRAAPDVRRLPHRAGVRRARPAAARRRRGGRPAAGRGPFAGLPPARRRRLLGLAQRAGARHHLARRQRRARRRQRQDGRPVPRRPRAARRRPRRHLTGARHHHPDDSGAGHADQSGAVLQLVGARRRRRAAALAAGPRRRAHLPVRRPPARPRRCSAATSASARGSGSP